MLSAPVYETTIPRGETLGLRLKFNSDDPFGPPIVIGYKTNCSTIIRSKVDINDTISWFDGKPHFRVPKRCYDLKADYDRMLVVLKTSQVDEDQSGGSYLYFQRMRDNDLKNLFCTPSSISSPSSTKAKKLIAMMTDSSTKTVRVSVNNEEVVITARELEEDQESDEDVRMEEGGGEQQGMMTMMGDNGGVGEYTHLCQHACFFVVASLFLPSLLSTLK